MSELSSGIRNCFWLSLTGILISIFNIYKDGLRAKMLFGCTVRKGNGYPVAEPHKAQVEEAHSRGGARDPLVTDGSLPQGKAGLHPIAYTQ